MKALVRTGHRVMRALRSPAAMGCPRCESLRQQIEALREENARLRASLMDAQRAAKRQAAPFSKGRRNWTRSLQAGNRAAVTV